MSANTLVTTSVVAKEVLPIIENMLGFASAVNRDYQAEYDSNMSRGYPTGPTINIKRPPRYTYRVGSVAVPQATVETTVPLTLSPGGCDINFSLFEKTLSLKDLEKKLLAAAVTVCTEIDRQGLQMARLNTFNTIGTPGTLPTSQALAMGAITGLNQRLDEMGAPRDKQRALIMNPALNGAIVQGFAGMFNGQDKLSKQFGQGVVVDSLGLTYAMDQCVSAHTNGTQAVAGTNVNGAGQTGSNITVVGLGGTITRGTKITLPGCFAVNPQTRQSTGTLAQFVVTADVAAAATVLPISPAIVVSGAFQNVTASPTTGQPFVIFGTASGTYASNVAFHKDAFTLAMVPMKEPATGVECTQMTHNGLTVKVTKGYDIINDNEIMRIDVLYGWAATYPELACIYAT